jgi:hypothetical protein
LGFQRYGPAFSTAMPESMSEVVMEALLAGGPALGSLASVK